MDVWHRITGFLAMRMEALGLSAADVPAWLVILALVLPLLLAALARQPLAFFSVLIVVCGLLAIDPASASAGALAACGAYIASVLMGVIAVQSTYRNRAIGQKLTQLREDLDRLMQEQAQTRERLAAAVVAPAAEPVVPPAPTVAPVVVVPPPPEPAVVAVSEPIESAAPGPVVTPKPTAEVLPPGRPAGPGLKPQDAEPLVLTPEPVIVPPAPPRMATAEEIAREPHADGVTVDRPKPMGAIPDHPRAPIVTGNDRV